MLGKETAMRKQRKSLRIWAALALLCGALLCGCASTLATEGSDPYTPDDVIAMTEETFSSCRPRLVLVETQVEKEKPFERRIYTLRDTANDFTFSAHAVVRRPELPRPGAGRDTDALFAYAEGYAAFFTLKGPNDWAATLADNPGSSSNETDPAVMEKNLARYFDSCLHGAQTASAGKHK